MTEQFVLPAEFRDGMYLTATQLNYLSDAISTLHGRHTAPMMARSSIFTNTELTSTNNVWRIRHMANYSYIAYSMQLNGSSMTGDLTLYALKEDNTAIANTVIASSPAPGSWTGNLDISGGGLNEGEWYKVYVDSGDLNGGTFEVHYLDETNSTSLTYPTATGDSWTAQPLWSHGDAPATAKLQAYTDGLNYIYDLVGDVGRNPAVLVDREKGPQGTDHEDSGLTFVHLQPWLIFRGTGEVRHPTQPSTFESVSLSDEDTLTAFDLSAVSWLQYGDIYRVIGCDWACEAMEAG